MSTLGRFAGLYQPAARRKRLDPKRLRQLIAEHEAQTGAAVDLPERLIALADRDHGAANQALAEALIAVAGGKL